MKRRICFVLAVVILVALCACQPTPESEVVVNKGDGAYEQKIEIAKREEKEATDTEVKEEIPEVTFEPAPTEVPVYEFEPHWTDTVSLKNFDIDIDVDVEAPTTAISPVYRVKSTPFAMEDARLESICKALIGDINAVRSGGATIQDLKEQLEQLQLGEYDSETQSWHPYDKETYDELAGDIMKEMETAPDEGDFTSYAVQFESLPAQLTYKAADGTLWELYYQENSLALSRNLRCVEQPESWVMAGGAISGEAQGTTLQNLSCTEEEARQFVQAFLKLPILEP